MEGGAVSLFLEVCGHIFVVHIPFEQPFFRPAIVSIRSYQVFIFSFVTYIRCF